MKLGTFILHTKRHIDNAWGTLIMHKALSGAKFAFSAVVRPCEITPVATCKNLLPLRKKCKANDTTLYHKDLMHARMTFRTILKRLSWLPSFVHVVVDENYSPKGGVHPLLAITHSWKSPTIGKLTHCWQSPTIGK